MWFEPQWRERAGGVDAAVESLLHDTVTRAVAPAYLRTTPRLHKLSKLVGKREGVVVVAASVPVLAAFAWWLLSSAYGGAGGGMVAGTGAPAAVAADSEVVKLGMSSQVRHRRAT